MRSGTITGLPTAPPPRQKTKHPGVYFRDNASGRVYIIWYKCGGCKPDFTCPGHNETLPAGKGERDAVRLRASKVATVTRGEQLVTDKVRLRDYAPVWHEAQKSHLKPRTHELYGWAINKWILPNLGSMHLNDLRTDNVVLLINHMKKEGKKATTIRNVLKVLSGICGDAARSGKMTANPVLGLRPRERPKNDQRKMRVLSQEEIGKLLEAATPRWRPLLTTLVFTGLRISEAQNLRWADVDFDAEILTVRESKTEAGARQVVLMPSLVSVLKRHFLASLHKDNDDLVFGRPATGTPDDRQHAARGMRDATRKAKLADYTMHELRHTYASILVGQGLDITYICNQLGHANPGITLKFYAQLFEPDGRRAEARDKLESAFGGLL